MAAWISCTERLPPRDAIVLVFSEDVGFTIGYTMDNLLRDAHSLLDPNCAWWMPLPDVPTGGPAHG